MRLHIVVIAFFVAACSAAHVDAQTVSMQCFNPRVTVPVDVGAGRASSKPVQFNIGLDAPPGGAIFVNPNNDGVCVAKLDNDHVFTRASYVILPGGSYTEGNPSNPKKIESTIKVESLITGIREVTFRVIHSKANPADKGNVTITFFVEYQ
jgi:hypothetical protein